MAKTRATDTEILTRVEELLRIRLDGAQLHDCVAYAQEKGWNVTDRQIRTYIRRADELLVERQDRNRKRLFARHVAQREALFARAVNAADYRTALAVADSLAMIQGMFTDPKELKELTRLATAQAEHLRDLEKRLSDAGQTPGAREAERGPSGAAPGDGAGRTEGAT